MGGPVYFEIYERYEGRKYGIRFQLNDISDLDQTIVREIQKAFHREHAKRKKEDSIAG